MTTQERIRLSREVERLDHLGEALRYTRLLAGAAGACEPPGLCERLALDFEECLAASSEDARRVYAAKLAATESQAAFYGAPAGG